MNDQAEWSGDNPEASNAAAAEAASNDPGVGPDAGPWDATAAAPQGGEEAERVRLDAAMRRADELLVDSLRRDEGRRQRRRRRNIVFLLGGLVMTAILCVLLAALAGQGKTGADGAKPDGAKPADVERSAALNTEGWQLWQQRKLPDAEAKFAEAVKLDPANANAWNGLGWSLFNQGKAGKAIEPFEKAVAVEADHPAALNGLGQVYLSQGKMDEAEKHLLKAASMNASAAWWGLTRLYLARSDFDRALPWALLITKEQPDDAGAGEMLEAARTRKIGDKLRKQIAPAAKKT